MQQLDRIDVLTTRLAATDRRALSQAWYSALHLADHAPNSAHGPSARVARPPACALVSRAGSSPAPRRVTSAAVAPSFARTHAGRRDVAAHAPERRAPKTALAHRLERALLRRGQSEPQAFTLRAGVGRVRLMVRSDGVRTRVVAICAPGARERVERALAQARFALTGRAVTAEVA